MFNAKVLAGSAALYIILQIISGLGDGLMFVLGQESLINNLITGTIVEVSAGGIWTLSANTPGFFNSFLAIAPFNYPMYNNIAGLFFKTIILYPISVLLIANITIPFLSGVFGILGTLVRR